MSLWLILAIVFILNLRTWFGKNRHYHIIDDMVRRWGYLYDIPDTSPPPQFYSTQPHPWRHFFLTFTHCLNVWVVYMLWGWEVAAVFALHPIAANVTGWITGGYYSVTTFLTLTAYFFITTYPNIIGGAIGSIFFTAALGSTINCISFPFIFLFASPWGLMLLWPLTMYLTGNRFQTGFRIRDAGKKDKITWRKPAVMTKVMAYYLRIMLFPNKLAFFRKYGSHYNKDHALHEKVDLDSYNKEFFVALALVATFTVCGWIISPIGTIWFLFLLAPFTQFKVLGQFIAERYLYLPSVGIAIVVGTFLSSNSILLAVVLTAYAYRYHIYLPAFRNIENLYKNGIVNYPDCVANYCNLGERYLHTTETLKAYRLFEDALRLEPKSFLAWCNMAAYWISVGNLYRAEVCTRKAMEFAEQGNINTVLDGQLKNVLATIVKKDAESEGRNREATGYQKEVVLSN